MDMEQEKKLIYYMQNREYGFLFHFFMFTISALRHCKGERPIIYIPYMRPTLKEVDANAIRSLGFGDHELNTTRGFPPDYNWDNCKINYEICELLKDKYQFIYTLEELPSYESYTIVKSGGEENDVWGDSFQFLKSLFEDIVGKAPLNPNKYIYITRKGSEIISLHGGKKVRCILNEDELLNAIQPLGFQCVQLETLSFIDKIRLFQSAKIVVAPNTAALMFCLFSTTNSHIVELIPRYIVGQFKTHWKQTQYQEMCEMMNISYTRFQSYTYVEDYLNGTIDIPSLVLFLQSIVNST